MAFEELVRYIRENRSHGYDKLREHLLHAGHDSEEVEKAIQQSQLKPRVHDEHWSWGPLIGVFVVLVLIALLVVLFS